MTIVDEQSRLKARIADFEFRIAKARGDKATPDNRLMSNADRDLMLQMLVRTPAPMIAQMVQIRRPEDGTGASSDHASSPGQPLGSGSAGLEE